MVMPVGAHQIRQQLRVGGIGFRARNPMSVPVAGHRHRIDRIHLIAASDQCAHPQAVVFLNADHDLTGIISMARNQIVQLSDSGQSLR